MADILLTHSNHVYYDSKQVRKMQPYPPLQTILAAAVMRREGFDVAFFDATLNPPEQGFHSALRRHRPRLVAICEDNFNFLTKMCLKRNRELTFTMAGVAKELDIPVIVNGSDASDRPEEYLGRGTDAVIIGELEVTLAEVAHRWLSGLRCLSGLRGVAYRDSASGEVRYGPPRPPLKHLGSLPMPAWDLVEMPAYRDAWIGGHGFFSLNMISSRGCPFHCNWCAKPIYGQTYRFVPPQRVAEEMCHLKHAYGPDQIWFADDIFALSAKWTRSFSSAVERLNAQIPFKMQSRCDLMTGDTVGALKRAGCAEVWMGAESGSQEILDAMEKGIRVEQIYQATENLHHHDIRACLFLQFGYPGESWRHIQSTIRMVRETSPDDIGVSVSYPLPGTEFHRRVAAELGAKQNWSESGDLSMMFRGTYTSEFYGALRDALHSEVAARKENGNNGSDSQTLKDLWSRVQRLAATSSNAEFQAQWISS